MTHTHPPNSTNDSEQQRKGSPVLLDGTFNVVFIYDLLRQHETQKYRTCVFASETHMYKKRNTHTHTHLHNLRDETRKSLYLTNKFLSHTEDRKSVV